jgi:hypothetical protein
MTCKPGMGQNWDRRKKLFVKLFFINHLKIQKTCDDVGVSRQTYYDWMLEDPNFKTAIEDKFEEIIDKCEGRLVELIDNGDLDCVKFWLNHKGKHRGWGKQDDNGGTVVQVNIIDGTIDRRE